MAVSRQQSAVSSRYVVCTFHLNTTGLACWLLIAESRQP